MSKKPLIDRLIDDEPPHVLRWIAFAICALIWAGIIFSIVSIKSL